MIVYYAYACSSYGFRTYLILCERCSDDSDVVVKTLRWFAPSVAISITGRSSVLLDKQRAFSPSHTLIAGTMNIMYAGHSLSATLWRSTSRAFMLLSTWAIPILALLVLLDRFVFVSHYPLTSIAVVQAT